jgi:hypothetical protein
MSQYPPDYIAEWALTAEIPRAWHDARHFLITLDARTSGQRRVIALSWHPGAALVLWMPDGDLSIRSHEFDSLSEALATIGRVHSVNVADFLRAALRSGVLTTDEVRVVECDVAMRARRIF